METQYNVNRNHIFGIAAMQYKLPSHYITRRVSIEARNSVYPQCQLCQYFLKTFIPSSMMAPM